MKNFNIIFEQCLFNNTIKDNESIKKEYRSLQEFKHFCDQLNLIVKFIEQSKLSYIVKLYKDNKTNQQEFDYYYKFNPHYYQENKQIFDALSSYKEKYIVTIDGTENSKKVLY